jgi:hypothetical protein
MRQWKEKETDWVLLCWASRKETDRELKDRSTRSMDTPFPLLPSSENWMAKAKSYI